MTGETETQTIPAEIGRAAGRRVPALVYALVAAGVVAFALVYRALKPAAD